jgi:hypothetical protein
MFVSTISGYDRRDTASMPAPELQLAQVNAGPVSQFVDFKL